jgi:hypothetical protein
VLKLPKLWSSCGRDGDLNKHRSQIKAASQRTPQNSKELSTYFTCYHLVVDSDGLAALCAVAVRQCFNKILVKVSAEIVHKAVWIVLKHEHLSAMRLAHAMTLETVLVATCLLTHLTIPSQLCEPFGFDAVAYSFGGEESAALFSLSH